MGIYLPATPNQQRRLRLLESAVEDFREGAPVVLTAGIAGEAAAGELSIAGFAVEANEPADPTAVPVYTEPVFGAGGGVSGGPFAVDVHPGAADGSREQCLVAIAHAGATFIMDFVGPSGDVEPPPIAAVGALYDLIADPAGGAWAVDGTGAVGVTVIGVNIVTDNRDQGAVPGTIARTRLEVAVITPQLPG